MKKFLSSFFLYAFLVVIAIMIVAATIITGVRAFEFYSNAVSTLAGVLAVILLLIGIVKLVLLFTVE